MVNATTRPLSLSLQTRATRCLGISYFTTLFLFLHLLRLLPKVAIGAILPLRTSSVYYPSTATIHLPRSSHFLPPSVAHLPFTLTERELGQEGGMPCLHDDADVKYLSIARRCWR